MEVEYKLAPRRCSRGYRLLVSCLNRLKFNRTQAMQDALRHDVLLIDVCRCYVGCVEQMPEQTTASPPPGYGLFRVMVCLSIQKFSLGVVV